MSKKDTRSEREREREMVKVTMNDNERKPMKSMDRLIRIQRVDTRVGVR
jgi:hypothetical protein